MPFENFNSSNATQNSSSFTFFYLCIVIGTLSIVTNLIIIFITLYNISIFKKSAYMCGLALGDILKATALVVAGITRIEYQRLNILNVVVSRKYCWKTIGIILLLGLQIPAIMVFLIGIERFVAVILFQWYYSNWSDTKAWIATCIGYCLI